MNKLMPMIDFMIARPRVELSLGDYAILRKVMKTVGERLTESLCVQQGQRVLDLSGGSSSFALEAVRRSANVTPVDCIVSSLNQAPAGALAGQLDVAFQLAHPERLPFEDGSFDIVGSTFGVPVSLGPEHVAAELLRVCRKGGKIGLIRWSLNSFVGGLFGAVHRKTPPRSPCFPKIEPQSYLEKLFSDAGADVHVQEKRCVIRYRSADHWLEIFQNCFGDADMAAADQVFQDSMKRDIIDFVAKDNVAADRMTVVSEYQEIIVTRR